MYYFHFKFLNSKNNNMKLPEISGTLVQYYNIG